MIQEMLLKIMKGDDKAKKPASGHATTPPAKSAQTPHWPSHKGGKKKAAKKPGKKGGGEGLRTLIKDLPQLKQPPVQSAQVPSGKGGIFSPGMISGGAISSALNLGGITDALIAGSLG